ncbi:MAG: hypothetical protein KGL44_09055 [Sphingomonadales bacterium]|nr:hypothetical protein [Sphingomonadales bacterium]
MTGLIVKAGTAIVGGSPTAIMVNPLDPPLHADPQAVVLTVPFIADADPHFPAEPYATGCEHSKFDRTTAVPAGTKITVLACVAAALIAAGAATAA